ncbi:MAG: patatin-like phospholipase family protein [Tannerella sp.]|jgi:NTE family protein|nr:patatin-like phospholipase family protein [Tannerella sp.]
MIHGQENKKYKWGLALSGGGARGFAHIGVFRLLEECGLRPDIIVGTSAGALMGTLYADGYAPDEIMSLFTGREFSEFASVQFPVTGLFDSSKFHSYVKKIIRAEKFEDLQIPMTVMTTDLDHGKAHAFAKGPIADVITASCSVPILFNPVVIDGVCHVDGGLFHNFPVSIIRDECDAVIGSNVSPVVPEKYNKNIIGIAERSYHYLFRSNTEKDRTLCDILIETDEFGKYKMFDLKNVEQIVRIGYDAAVRAFDEYLNNRPIAKLIKSFSVKTKLSPGDF